MKAEIKGNKLVISDAELNMDPPPSSTGKTLIMLYDFVKVPAGFKGREVKVAVTVTVKP